MVYELIYHCASTNENSGCATYHSQFLIIGKSELVNERFSSRQIFPNKRYFVKGHLTTFYGYRLSDAICYNSRKQKQGAIMKLCKLGTNVLVNFPFSPMDTGRLLVCCLGARNELESFGAIGLSVAITSRFKYRMTRLFRPSSSFRLQEPCSPSQILYCSIEYKSSVSHHRLGYY